MKFLGRQNEMYLEMGAAALIAFFGGVRAARLGHWWLLPIWMLLLAPIVMYGLRRYREDDYPPLFNNLASRAFMYGDTAILPFAFGFAGYGWQKVPVSSWARGYTFAVICLVIGSSCSFIFRLVDRKKYIESDRGAMLYCPTKVWHDMAIFPLTIALLVWLLLPQLITACSVATVAALAFLCQFVLLMILELADPPDPDFQHVMWDKIGFRRMRIRF